MSSSESELAGLSGSWYRPRFITMALSALILALGLLCGLFILYWKAWLVYDETSNAVDFKCSLLAYTIAHPNVTDEVQEWWGTYPFPMSVNPNKSDLDDLESTGKVSFAFILIAVISGAFSFFGAVSLAMPPAYKCDCVSARGRCEMITMLIFDFVTFLFGFIGFIAYYAGTSDARKKVVCFNNDPCLGDAKYGDAFALGAFAGICALIAFGLHMLAYCCCSGSSYVDSPYEYEYNYEEDDSDDKLESSEDSDEYEESYEYEYESSS